MRNQFTLVLLAGCLVGNGLVGPAILPAQAVRPTLIAIPLVPRHSAAIRWYHASATIGLIAAMSLLDQSIRDEAQEHRSATKDDIAKVTRHMGEPVIYAPIALGTLGLGLISGNDRITRAGGRITGSLITAGVVSSLLKPLVGRKRPPFGRNQYDFAPFGNSLSWPSGHSTMAFALATSLSDELHSTPATIGLYAAASATAWSRVNDNRHWVSDVLMGAAIGITSAKVINGRWNFLGVRGPRFLVERDRVGLSVDF